MPHRKSPRDFPQAEQKHPDAYERDLNPNRLGGQNIGGNTAVDDPHGHRASDLKELVTQLHHEFRNDELRDIPVLTKGARLKQGGTYLDLADPDRDPFTATGGEHVTAGSYMVPKNECPPAYWNRLLGMKDPRRTI